MRDEVAGIETGAANPHKFVVATSAFAPATRSRSVAMK